MTKTPFKLKYKNLEGVVDELANASKMHKKQSEVIEDHIADMEGESPAKNVPIGGNATFAENDGTITNISGKDNRPPNEDPIKIQALHRKGLTPGSQEFVKKVKENVKSKKYVELSDLEKHDDNDR